MRDHVDRAIRVDCQIDARLQFGFAHSLGSAGIWSRGGSEHFFGHPADAQDKSARAEHTLQESAAAAGEFLVKLGKVLDVNHTPSQKYGTEWSRDRVPRHPTAIWKSCKLGATAWAILPARAANPQAGRDDRRCGRRGPALLAKSFGRRRGGSLRIDRSLDCSPG